MANIKGGHKGGRPTKLTPELQDKICMYLRLGNYIETTCHLVGLPKSTFFNWMAEGRKAQRSTNKYAKFMDSVFKAMAWSETTDLGRISKAAAKDWKAAAWRLERKYPQKWGRKDFLAHSEIPADSEEEKPERLNMSRLTTEELELREQLDKKAMGHISEDAELLETADKEES